MRTLMCLTALLGCADPSSAPTTGHAASTAAPATASNGGAPSTRSQGSTTSKGKGKGKGKPRRTGKKAQGAGATPRTLPNAVSTAEQNAQMLARCSDGHVVFSFWSGEYPEPAIQLDRPLRTRVMTDPCGGSVTRGCSAPAGLYHPWAKAPDRPEGVVFGTRTMPTTYTLKKDHQLDGTSLSKGTSVEVLTYLSEGYCTMAAEGRVLQGMCPPNVDADDTWKRTSTDTSEDVQLIQVPCTGGNTGWLVIDDAFVEQDGARLGKIQGHGDVTRAP